MPLPQRQYYCEPPPPPPAKGSTMFFDAEYAEEHTPEEIAAARAAKLKESETTNDVGETILNVLDWVPFVGAISRSTQAIVKSAQGDNEGGVGALQQGGLNLAFDFIPIGKITKGVSRLGKALAGTGAKAAAKAGEEAAAKAASKLIVPKKAPSRLYGPKKVALSTGTGAAVGVVMEATPLGDGLVSLFVSENVVPTPPSAAELKRLRDFEPTSTEPDPRSPIAAPPKADVQVPHGARQVYMPSSVQKTAAPDYTTTIVVGGLLVVIGVYLLSDL